MGPRATGALKNLEHKEAGAISSHSPKFLPEEWLTTRPHVPHKPLQLRAASLTGRAGSWTGAQSQHKLGLPAH